MKPIQRIDCSAKFTSQFVSVLLLYFMLALSGCAANGPPFQAVSAPPDQAVVYVYRASNSFTGSGMMLDIDCDGKRFGVVASRGYTYSIIPPGMHSISSSTEITSTVHIDATAGRCYYIEAEVEMGFWIGRPRLTAVPEETGKLAIADTFFSPIPKVAPPPKPRH